MSTYLLKIGEGSLSPSLRTHFVDCPENLFKAWGAILVLLAALLFTPNAWSQQPKYEMRGAWVTTVYNLDWPLSRYDSPGVQRAEMANLFNELKSTGINAVFFQVRSEADAMYASSLEPWSRFLTGTQGRAPNPTYDPLAEAIEMAHDRGMELHAWINPFRAVSALGKGGLAASHVVWQRPDWILDVTYKGTEDDKRGSVITILDPGNPQARAWIVAVIDDIVSRYDVDGIHFDDYYYPYPPYAIGMEDETTFNTYGNDFASMEDWRRANVNAFMDEVSEAIRAANPGKKFGVSPIGIWRNGVPFGIVGLDTYDVVYADPLTWMSEDDVDYLVPQLYWPFGGGQDFAALAEWWAFQGRGTHIYPGIAAFKADPSTASGNLFSPDEIPAQVSLGRTISGIQGNLFFRARNLGTADNQGLTQRLTTDFYQYKAITPYMEYRDTWPPDPPTSLTVTTTSQGRALRWDPAITGFTFANRFAIYRSEDDGATPDPRAITNEVANLLHISWEPEWTDFESLQTGVDYHYVVTSLSPNSIESTETNLVTVRMQDTAVDPWATDPALVDWSVYPNPAVSSVRMEMTLDRPIEVDLRIYDMLGREVARPAGAAASRSAGRLDLSWDLRGLNGQTLTPGVYQMRLRTGRQQTVRSLVIVR